MAVGDVIGREVERAAIEQWLAGGRPSMLRIEGVAGIGKSTLWNYALDRAVELGRRPMSWRASAAERDLAFAALTALFDVPAALAALAEIPEPRRRALEIALGRADPRQESPGPRMVGLAVADLLRALAADGPVVIAIDDLQWTDRATEDALAFAARRLADSSVGFVIARRTDDGTGARVSDANRTWGDRLATAVETAERIEVGPLSVGALGRLTRDRLGVALPRPLLVRVHSACAGNSFLALEISRSLVARDTVPTPGEPFPVPAEVGPLVRDHLAVLGDDARRAVALVAMSPDPRLDLIARALGRRGVPAIDEACRKGILVAEGDRLRAAHPLFTSTAYGDVPPGERRRLRRVLAGLVDDPVERAVHLAATVDGRDDAAADALADAGRLASGRGAPGVAAELLERAARAAEALPRRGSLLIDAAVAAVAAGDPDTAAAHLHTALDLVPAGRIRAAALLALGDIEYVQRPTRALPLLVAALEHTEGDPLLEAEVHSYIAGMADMDPAQANHSADRAAEILTRQGLRPDPEHLACALLERTFHRLLNGEPAAPEDIDRGLALRSGTGDTFIARRSQEVAERCLFHFGRLGEALALDQAEYRRLQERSEFGLLPPMVQSLSVLCQLAGDWPAARRYAEECADLVAQGAEAWRDRAVLAMGRIHAWEGDLEAARAVGVPALALQEEAGDRWEAIIFCALLGFVELSVPDAPAALGYLTRALAHADAIEVRLPTQFRFLGDLVEAAVLAGDLDLAERVLVDRLESAAHRQPLPWTVAMSRRGRGLLTMAQGDLAGAVDSLDRALEVFDADLPMPFERGRTLFARGQARRRAGHRRAARADLATASASFADLGARAWLRIAEGELGRIGGRAPTGTALTTSERAVAERAADGQSNKEIAAALMISTRTIESQLSAVYRKLDIRSRGQLAAALRASGYR
jgi:DNA-binding CsgD family transcriptional regulator/tetratricopeptide (TPR) repeat protein